MTFLQAKASALKDIIAEIDEDGKKRLLDKFYFFYSILPGEMYWIQIRIDRWFGSSRSWLSYTRRKR